MSSKLQKVSNGVQTAQIILGVLSALGVDVDKVVHLSNGTGPQSKILQTTLGNIVTDLSSRNTTGQALPDSLEPSPVKAPKKRKPKSSKVK